MIAAPTTYQRVSFARTPAPFTAKAAPAVEPVARVKTLMESALEWGAKGYKVFPCSGKIPRVVGGFKAASKDPGQIKTWWTQWPDATIGLVTESLLVLDVDCKPSAKYPKGAPGYASLAKLEAKHGKLPATRVVKTVSGGTHYWYQYADGARCTTDKIAPGIDTRSQGGYVIAPPSPGYVFVDESVPIAPAPAWVLKALEGPTVSKVGQPARFHGKINADIEAALSHLSPECSYNDWLEVGMALHSWDAAAGLPVFVAWSRKSRGFREGEPETKWRSFTGIGGITIQKLFDLAEAAGWARQFPAYYDHGKKEYILQNERGTYLSLAEAQIKKEMQAQGVRAKAEKGEALSPADRELVRIRNTMDVSYSGVLSGYDAGFYDEGGDRFIVTESPRLLEPVAGPWDTLELVLGNMLSTAGEADQLPYLLSWLKLTLEALYAKQRRHQQAIALAGPRDSGKSLVQALITVMLGGRSANPYQYMSGETPFNGDHFGAAHLAIDDEFASTDIRTRRAVGQAIKQITVGTNQRCHRKGRDALMLKPFWRLTISLNEEPEDLMVLPPMDDSIMDKLMLLRCHRKPMPYQTTSLVERTAFWKKLVGELPAFIHFLLHDWQVPGEIVDTRFGVKAYHHPDLLDALAEAAPEGKLLALIDSAKLLIDKPEWIGTAEDLESYLLDPIHGVARQAGNLLKWGSACGTYLARLEKQYPTRITKHRTNHSRNWTIRADSAQLPLPE
jgi:hypothetical protein